MTGASMGHPPLPGLSRSSVSNRPSFLVLRRVQFGVWPCRPFGVQHGSARGSCRQPGVGMALCRALGARTMLSEAADRRPGAGFCATLRTRHRGPCCDTARSRLLLSCQGPDTRRAVGPPCGRWFADPEAWAVGGWQSWPPGSWLPLLAPGLGPRPAPLAWGSGTRFLCARICTAWGFFRRRGTASSHFTLVLPPQTRGRGVGRPRGNGAAWVLPICGALGLGDFHFEYP